MRSSVSASSIYVGGGEAEIDIRTDERYRGRGYARLTACAFIEACLEKGLRPALVLLARAGGLLGVSPEPWF